MTREKILVTSAGAMFKDFSERIDQNGVVGALSGGTEYEEILNGHRSDAGLGQVEKRILAEGVNARFASGMTAKDQARLQDMDDGTRRKALALLWAYLGRVELDDTSLNNGESEFVVQRNEHI